MIKKSSAILLALIVGIVFAAATFIIVSSSYNDVLEGGSGQLALKEFLNVESVIEKYYLRDYDIEDVQYAGLKAMVASLGDPYSVYYTPDEFKSFNQS